MTTSSEYSVVDVGHKDYEAVMDINRSVYSGLDYLPAMFHSFLHNPNVRMLGGRRNSDGKLVSCKLCDRNTLEVRCCRSRSLNS